MKILVTGGAGFIGSHIVDLYLKNGHEVVVVDDLSTGVRENIDRRAKFYHMAIEDEQLEDVFSKERPDVLNHQAAQVDVRVSIADPVADANVNILATLKLFEVARKHQIKKIIFASSGGAVYGEQESFPADENHPTNPGNPYGITKLAIEKYLSFYEKAYQIPFVALRYANVYGPRQSPKGEAGVVAIFAKRIFSKQAISIFGDGRQTRDYVFVHDVAQCSVEALSSDLSGIFNVGTGVETSVNQLATLLVELADCEVPVEHVPAPLAEQIRSCLVPGKLQQSKITQLHDGLSQTVKYFSQ